MTVTVVTNIVVSLDAGRLHDAIESVLAGVEPPRGHRLELWDGRAAERTAGALARDEGGGHAEG